MAAALKSLSKTFPKNIMREAVSPLYTLESEFEAHSRVVVFRVRHTRSWILRLHGRMTCFYCTIVFYVTFCCHLQLTSSRVWLVTDQTASGELTVGTTLKLTFVMTTDSQPSGNTIFTVNVNSGATANSSSPRIVYNYYTNWTNPIQDSVEFHADLVDGLKLSNETDPDFTRKVIFDFDSLSDNHDELYLSAVFQDGVHTSDASSTQIILNVSACKSLSGQEADSNVVIDESIPGNYMDEGTCVCRESQQVTFIAGKRVSNVSATCGPDTEWKGCESVQCWSGPQIFEVVQSNYTASVSLPFQCNFTEGFPNSTNVSFQINDTVISGEYQLQSYDHGKELSCSVVSDFTIAVNKIYESKPRKIKVYFPPENSRVSKESPIIIKVNKSEVLNYSVSANPEYGDIKVTLKKASEANSEDHANITKIATKNTRHIYECIVRIDSDEDYGTYQICASTQNPIGTDCADFSICNFSSPTTSPPDATTFSVTTDTKKPNDPGIPATIIGAIVAGALLLVLIVGVVFVLWKRRRKAPPNTDQGREERLNELYGSAQYQTPATENPVSVRQEKANVLYESSSGAASGGVVEYAMANPDGIVSDDVVEYATSNPDVVTPNMTESTSTAEQPCSSTSDVYAQINKKKGKLNHGYNKEIPDAKTDTSAVTYTAVDKPKKRKKDVVPEVYATVNKPRTKG